MPGAGSGIHYPFRTLVGAHHDGGRASPPEAEQMPSRSPCRPGQSLVEREVLGDRRSRPTQDVHHFAGLMPLLNCLIRRKQRASVFRLILGRNIVIDLHYVEQGRAVAAVGGDAAFRALLEDQRQPRLC